MSESASPYNMNKQIDVYNTGYHDWKRNNSPLISRVLLEP